jgi:pantothenate kinase type III
VSDGAPAAVLAIDIGSTRTHIAAVDIRELRLVDRVDFENGGFDAKFPGAVRKIVNEHPQIGKANISSCVKSLSAKAKELCVRDGGIGDVAIVRARGGLPVEFRYENQQALGADRVCNALACAALFKGENCVIIDSGTAITVDCLRAGRTFEGGAILPGCAMQAKALCAGTDALPDIDLRCIDRSDSSVDNGDIVNDIGNVDNTANTDIIVNKNTTISLPAASTTACIASGILYGAAGAVDRCVDECLCGNYSIGNARIVATGGGWNILKPLINHTVTTLPNLTLIGAAIFNPD